MTKDGEKRTGQREAVKPSRARSLACGFGPPLRDEGVHLASLGTAVPACEALHLRDDGVQVVLRIGLSGIRVALAAIVSIG